MSTEKASRKDAWWTLLPQLATLLFLPAAIFKRHRHPESAAWLQDSSSQDPDYAALPGRGSQETCRRDKPPRSPRALPGKHPPRHRNPGALNGRHPPGLALRLKPFWSCGLRQRLFSSHRPGAECGHLQQNGRWPGQERPPPPHGTAGQSQGEGAEVGYIRACERSSRSWERPYTCTYYKDLDTILGAGEPLPPKKLVESAMETPVQQQLQLLPDDPELQEEEEEEDSTRSTQEPDAQTQEASQETLDTEEGTAAGPPDQEGEATPAPPPRQPQGTQRHWCTNT
nr:uncharacterized protein LOC112547654 [Pelodiscus sinensis]|eukprot:XP_025046160.1 uncharacterized protein LOC112547654 [Pelodiscus sinensis]